MTPSATPTAEAPRCASRSGAGHKLKVLDLFSGIGGFSLGLERTGGFETVAFCEIEEFPRKVLAKHWPGIPIHRDIRELRGEHVGPVDVICGGYPCQPFSTASRGRRVAKDLWPEMIRVIREIRPRYVIAENVNEQAQRRASIDFRFHRYGAFVVRIGAHDAGADHTRNRWWAVAHPNDKGKLHSTLNAKMAELPSLCSSVWGGENYARAVRVSDGLPNRVDRLKALGNAVVPQIPEILGRAILAAESAATAAPQSLAHDTVSAPVNKGATPWIPPSTCPALETVPGIFAGKTVDDELNN